MTNTFTLIMTRKMLRLQRSIEFTFRTSAKVKTAAEQLQKKFKRLNENFWAVQCLAAD